MRRGALILLVAISLTGCASGHPALRDRTNALLTDYQARVPGLVTTPEGAAPRAWEVGQYVVYAVHRDGRPGLVRYAIEERTAEGVWLGIQELSYDTQTLWRVLLKRDPKQAGELVTLARRAIVQAEGNATRIYDFEVDSSPVVAKMREAMSALWTAFFPAPTLPGEPAAASTAAGRFEGTAPTSVRLDVLGVVSDFTGRRHDAVPISGLVQAETADKKASIELVEFGDDSASPLF